MNIILAKTHTRLLLVLLVTVLMSGCPPIPPMHHQALVSVVNEHDIGAGPPIIIDPNLQIEQDEQHPKQSFFGPEVNQKIAMRSDVPLMLVPAPGYESKIKKTDETAIEKDNRSNTDQQVIKKLDLDLDL